MGECVRERCECVRDVGVCKRKKVSMWVSVSDRCGCVRNMCERDVEGE